jgi:predicted permease
MSDFWGDVRFGLRLLAKSPVFTTTAVLLLGIGIGANTLIFSIVDALLLRSLPVNHAEQLVRLIDVRSTGFTTYDFPYAVCGQMGKASSLSEVLCQGDLDVAFEEGAAIERIRVNAVSGNFFSSLGIQAQLGRVLSQEDDTHGVPAAVISYDFWQRWSGGSATIVGRVIRLNERAFTVIGVLPKGMNGLTVDTSPDIRVPLSTGRLLVREPFDPALGPFFLQVFGRLRPEAGRARAEAEVEPLLIHENNKKDGLARMDAKDSHLLLEPAGNGVSPLRAQFSRGLVLLMTGVGLLLLMACANVACLLLARSAVRSQEIGVRLALGARPWRVTRQLLTESLVFALPGGVLGVLIAYSCMPLLLAALPPIRDRAAVVQPLAVHVNIDLRVLGFALSVSLLTALLSGLSPALQGARQDLAGSLRGNRTTTARMTSRNILVAGQIAVCVLLLADAGLLGETFARMRSMSAGFDRDHIVTFTIDPGLKGYKPDRARSLSRQFLEKTRSLPGVVAAAIASRGLMRGTGVKSTFAAAGTPIYPSDFLNSSLNSITPGYFDAMGMHIVDGRDFTWSEDNKLKPRRVIVNEIFARRFFPGRDAVGRLFGMKGPNGVAVADNQIIGVATDAKYRSLREEIPPTVYSAASDGFDSSFILHLRTRGEPSALISPVREVLRSLDSELPFVEVRTLREEVETSLWQERLLAGLSTLFGGFAALLAGIGLYGALDFAVKSRTREIGVRVALGATPLRVVRLLSVQTVLLVAAGIGCGIVLYAASTRWISHVLYGVAPSDNPVAIGWALLFVAGVAFLATASPIWRAVRTDPAHALRHE